MLHVDIARPEQRRTALGILQQELPQPQRERQIDEMLNAAARGDVSLEGLLIAQDDDQPVGAALFVLQPDGCGFVWPPAVAPEIRGTAAEAVADALLQAIGLKLDESQAWLGQSLLDPDNERDVRRLQRNGFEFLADLTYLRRRLDRNLPPADAAAPLRVEPLDPDAGATRLAAIIERTYAGSADCPKLNGVRTGLEAIAGHRLTGVPLPEGWMVFRDSGGDVGVLLLADQPEQDACELVYMGVVPESRGRGYGRRIVDVAVRRAAASGRRDLLLAVDERNRYAGTVYEAAGFEFLDRRRVHARRPQVQAQK